MMANMHPEAGGSDAPMMQMMPTAAMTGIGPLHIEAMRPAAVGCGCRYDGSYAS